MSGVSSYILTIAGIILISVIVELVMSDGQMNKYIKSIFAFFVVGVIIAPLPSLLSSDSVGSIFNYEEYQLQEDYLTTLNDSKIKVLSQTIQSELANEGYKNIVIEVEVSEGAIKEIYVDLCQLSIAQSAEHKDILKLQAHISEKIMDKFEIEKEKIVYEP